MGRVECTSISNLPTLSFLQNNRDFHYVTLPLVCLAMIHQVGWGFGFLLVTDFTDHYKSSFYNNEVPKRVPDEFEMGGIKLERSKVFSISIPAAKIESCWMEIRKFSPRMSSYHFLDYSSCSFAAEGVVALVNFRVRAHNNNVEGFLSHILSCSRAMLLAPSNRANVAEHGFDEFMRRYGLYVDADLYDNLLRAFPIEKYVQRTSLTARRVPEPPLITQLSSQPAAPPPAKVRRITGPQAMFQQQFTQTQPVATPATAPGEEIKFADTLPRRENALASGNASHGPGAATGSTGSSSISSNVASFSNVPNGTHVSHGSTNANGGFNAPDRSSRSNGSSISLGIATATSESQFHQPLPANTVLHRDWNLFAVNHVEFATFARIPVHSTDVGTSFITKCRIHSIRPDPAKLFIKPFRRTLKIPSMSLFLVLGRDLVRVELHTDKEKCNFLGLHEPEEAVNNITQLTQYLRKISGSTVEICLEKRLLELDFNCSKLYWTTTTGIRALAK